MKMKSLFLKLFIHINSFLWIVFLYVLNNKIYLVDINHTFKIKTFTVELAKYNELLNVILYLSIIFIMSLISIFLFKNIHKTSKDLTIKIKKINPIYREYLPVFLGVMIISLSLKDT